MGGKYVTSNGNGYILKWKNGSMSVCRNAARAEVTEVDTIDADSLLADGSYFKLFTASTTFYVWMNLDAGGNDPAPDTSWTGIAVSVSTGDADTAVATAVKNAVDGNSNFGASVASNTVTITHASAANVTNAVDVDTSFTISITTEGLDASDQMKMDAPWADVVEIYDATLENANPADLTATVRAFTESTSDEVTTKTYYMDYRTYTDWFNTL